MIEDIKLRRGRFNQPPAKGTCRECPLRRDSTPGALGGWTANRYLDGMLRTPADFACHLSKGFNQQDPTLMRSCTGVANFRANVNMGAVLPEGNAREAMEAAGKNETDVFATPDEFFRHHRGKEDVS